MTKYNTNEGRRPRSRSRSRSRSPGGSPPGSPRRGSSPRSPRRGSSRDFSEFHFPGHISMSAIERLRSPRRVRAPVYVSDPVGDSVMSTEAPQGIDYVPIVRPVEPPLVGVAPSATPRRWATETVGHHTRVIPHFPSPEATIVRPVDRGRIGLPPSATRLQYLLVTLPDGRTTVVPREQLGGSRKRRKSRKRGKRGKGGKTRGKKN